MKHHDAEQKNRYSSGLEDNLKKALTELLILFLFGEEEHYIGELSPLLEKRSHGVLSIVFPYAAIYRITQSGYLTETKKKTAPDGRLRQYYAITETGRAYLQKLLETYQAFFQGVNDILLRGDAGVMVKFTNAEFILAFVQITDADVNPVINKHRLESGTHLLIGFAAGFGFYAVLQSRFFFG